MIGSSEDEAQGLVHIGKWFTCAFLTLPNILLFFLVDPHPAPVYIRKYVLMYIQALPRLPELFMGIQLHEMRFTSRKQYSDLQKSRILLVPQM